ncbi:MAG: hypothetical protein JRI68_07350 [Deltaproteobacteria bacterium]|nr:hypothetical protein [Deltaproteobacteria bacterium]
MGLKDKVVTEGMKLATHPRVAPLLQDERFMRLFMTALSVPGKLSELTDEQRENFIKVLGLAKAQDVADLKRTVRALEDELGRLRAELGQRSADEE